MSVAVSEDTMQAILSEVCARNQPIEIHYIDKQDRSCVAKSRFLCLKEDRILIDRPTVGRNLAPIGHDTVIFASFSMQHERFGFQARTRRTTLFQLNEQKRLTVLEITRPAIVERQQRRADFRVSLDSHTDGNVWFEPIEPDSGAEADGDVSDRRESGSEQIGEADHDLEGEPQTESGERKSFKARIANVSSSGMAAVIDIANGPHRKVKAGDQFWVSFQLPGEQELFRFAAEVRHTRWHSRPATLLAGCKFLMGEEPFDQSRSLQRLARFVAREQRRQLRRRK